MGRTGFGILSTPRGLSIPSFPDLIHLFPVISSRLWRAAALLCCAASVATAQDPSRDYYTIETSHFRVSFTKPLEGLARRVAANAERAFTQLTAELHPPRGTIEVLVTDDFDFANGSAITYPTNRIVVYAMPPVNDFGLRYTTDWAQMVVTHELAHIFHLDRSRGVWGLAQKVFGRSPFLFPNLYQPSWLIEGLAVYEESRIAGQGRIEGPEHNLLARAAAIDHEFPDIGGLSLARPTFPQGTSAYGYGSLFLEYLARTRGDSSIRRFVESSSEQPIPYLIDLPAKRAFGTRFPPAWREWQKAVETSVTDSARLSDSARSPMPGWRDITRDHVAANYPRWMNAGTLTFTGTSGRDILSAFAVTTEGERTRLGRRNGLSPTVRLPNGDLLFSQFEYIGAYAYRSDLFTQRPGDRPRRLTTNERLFTPDVRPDGSIIAMQSVDGATRIVRVARDGSSVVPITRLHADTLWSEPRWSNRGDRIVTSRWIRGGVAQIVIIDTAGAHVAMIASGRQLFAAPAWTSDDSAILYTAGGRESNDAWLAPIGSDRHVRLTRSAAGFLEPAVLGSSLAGFTLRGGGYRLGVGTLSADSSNGVVRQLEFGADPRLPALAVDSSPAKGYSAIRQMVPRYWVPLMELGGESGTSRIGGYTEAWDILRRHYAYLELRVPTDNSGIVSAAQYQYRGFGLPVLSASASQDWTPNYARILSRASPPSVLGTLRRRIRDGEVLATYSRPRARSSFTTSFGGGIEQRSYVTEPGELLASVDSGGFFRTAVFPRLTLAASYARYDIPPYAISPEDGFAVALTVRERLKSEFNGTGGPSTSVVSTLALFKSLDLPGYSHHVLAGRLSGGWADTKTNAHFEVGGLSGSTFQVFSGYTIGEGRRTFPVRGFAPATLQGIRAMAGSVEYRAPLSLVHRSVSTLPTFLQRSSLTLFGDYGVAWCPGTLTTRQVCFDPNDEVKRDIASVGGEVGVNAGLLSWDSATRLRLGLAVPVRNGSTLGTKSVTGYFTVGLSF